MFNALSLEKTYTVTILGVSCILSKMIDPIALTQTENEVII